MKLIDAIVILTLALTAILVIYMIWLLATARVIPDPKPGPERPEYDA